MAEGDFNVDGAAKSAKSDSKKCRSKEDRKTSVSMSVPENSLIVLKGSVNIAGNVVLQNGRNKIKIASALRKQYREGKKLKKFVALTEEEKEEREREHKKRRREENEMRWAAREQRMGMELPWVMVDSPLATG